jgi:hypothetical protein
VLPIEAMPKRHTPLFILSHMRSYSSVLSHVLGSHPQIDGYCETHLRYRFGIDFLRLQWRVRRLTGEPLRGRFVLDKMLHNYPLAPSLLNEPGTRAVILLRQPVEVLQSIVHMGTHLHVDARAANVADATRYYVARLQRLAQLARHLAERAAFVESEVLMAHTQGTLLFLRDFLQLDAPLERRYRTFSRTGQPGFGDPSAAIRSGEMGARRENRPRYSIPSTLIAEAVQAHSQCLAACNRHCVRMLGLPGIQAGGHPNEKRERASGGAPFCDSASRPVTGAQARRN